MKRGAVPALALMVVLAGCGGLGILGGSDIVVEKECVVVGGSFTECTAAVENPEDSTITVEVTADVQVETKSKRVELEPGERRNVSMTFSVAGDVRYNIDVEKVDG